ncbi:hypothetical protein V2K64_26650 [Pseudomonas alliivorans]|uniref:hypothetical protein n=1 Tax=Pseudomonas fragariae (ex Marin et al. 2024) TaxID=3080056 RepID=UPI002ED47514|nr:hypothetical protein [Pseudomonas alliivorans]MEE5133836.1 hypothetical protein [Pseudomonas alliivorans]
MSGFIERLIHLGPEYCLQGGHVVWSSGTGRDSLFHFQKVASIRIKQPVLDILVRGVPVYSASSGSLTRLQRSFVDPGWPIRKLSNTTIFICMSPMKGRRGLIIVTLLNDLSTIWASQCQHCSAEKIHCRKYPIAALKSPLLTIFMFLIFA